MKTLLNIIIAIIISTTCAFATTNEQKKEEDKNLVTITYTVSISCESCVKKVMNTIPFQKGVKDVVVNKEEKQVTVTFDPKKTTNDKLLSAFEKLKLDAEVCE